jgi:hypothetical protein
MSGQEQGKPAKEVLLTPSQIAEAKDLGATVKNVSREQGMDVGMDRSGQLSPSHTPGHTVRHR